jgi:hypothetical protein
VSSHGSFKHWPFAPGLATGLWVLLAPVSYLGHVNAASPCGWKLPPDATCPNFPPSDSLLAVGDALFLASAVLVVAVGWLLGRRSHVAAWLSPVFAVGLQVLAIVAYF